MMKRSLAIAALGLFLSACADDKPLNTFEDRGPRAKQLNDLMYPWIWGIMALVFVLVVFGGIALTIKNRVAPEDFDPDDLPEQVHGNPKLEWGWTAVPAVILAVISIPTIITIWSLEETNDERNADSTTLCDGPLDVMVIGQQWWWEYRYDTNCNGFFEDVNGDGVVDDTDKEWPLEIALDDDDLVVANQLVIPTGEQVDLIITSRDVIHSYWIPRLNGKRDAVPGRIHTWNIEADAPGEYNGWCTEYCGLSHARMRMSAVALTPAEFQDWLAEQTAPADIPNEEADHLAWEGRQLFQNNCASCHVVTEDENDPDDVAFDYGQDFEASLAARAAPNLTHFASRTVFAGAIFSQYRGVDADDDDLFTKLGLTDDDPANDIPYTELGESGLQLNEVQLRRWISNAPSMKAMDPDNLLGMPAFPQLTEEDLEALVAYLETLD